MKQLAMVALQCLILALCGCGGGGGGPTPSGGTTDGGDGGGDSGGNGGSTPPNSNSTAEIIFPWEQSGSLAQAVTVNGKASDPEGVAGVSVNRVIASITASGAAQNDNSEVAWSVQIGLSSGDNRITVSVEDENGGITEDAATVSIKYLAEVPTTFTLDPDATRLVGLSHSLTTTGTAQNLVQHNYDTDAQTVYEEISTPPSLTCFRRFEDEFLYLALDSGNVWNLHRYDLATRQESLLSVLPVAFLDAGAGFRAGWVRELVCGDTHTSAYILVNFIDDALGRFTKSRIVEFDLAALNFSTLSETDPTAPMPWIVQHIALDDEHIVGLHDISPLAPLTSFSLADGTRSDITPGLNIGGFVVYPELASNLAYVATLEGIDEINLIAGTRRNISIVSPDDPLAFVEIRAIGFDAANNRIIVGDEALDALIAIDVATGERSQIVSRRVGSGTGLVVPRRFAISGDGSRAYVADDGGNVAERLFEIDLSTGDRREIGDINQPFNFLVTGLVLDEVGRRVFVSFRHRILEVDLDTEEVNEVVNIDSSVLEQINGLLFDPGNNRLLVSDSINDGIYALSLEAGAIEVASREGEKGDGETFGTLVAITESGTATEVFAAGQASGKLFRVDLDTGDREVLSTSCDLGGSSNFQSLKQIRYNPAAGELLILDDTLYSLDLDSGQCDKLPRRVVLLDVQPASAEQLLALTFRELLQYDRRTGEVVVVSR